MAYTTIDDPSEYFQTKLYTGTGSSQAYTNDGNSDLQPDWLWIKIRSGADSHHVFDSTRGVTKRLLTDTNGAEATISDGSNLTAIGSDGFTLGGNGGVNGSSSTYVAWQWKANGGTTTTNDASATSVGTIDSVYQANTTAGFSIVTYTGTGSAGTIAHGVGATPHWVLVKNRSSGSTQWYNQHIGNSSASKGQTLSTNGAEQTLSAVFNDTRASSTVFSVGNNNSINDSGDNYVAYIFAPIKGYSKFGSYTGNSSTDGTFVYTGFKPAWIMIKHTGSFGGDQQYATWGIWDNKRATSNVVTQATMLTANTSYQEGNRGNNSSSTLDALDMLSNGFKIRNSSYEVGQSGTYIYMAFAEHPFVSSKGVPVTAR